ncbi:MAG: type II and III secretion system protein, partial [Candidatus Wallbacteria bacterium]|nr:type II and III secretion system protein [Candidatus Wallbacteria bacterium]
LSKEEMLREKKENAELTKLEAEERLTSKSMDPSLPNAGSTIQKKTPFEKKVSVLDDKTVVKGADIKTKEGTILPSRKVMALLAFETEENLKLIERLINDFDVKRPQVLIAVKIMDINKIINEKLGLLPSFDSNSDKIELKKLGNMSKIELDATLDFLENNKMLKTISNPTIRVVDGQSASVNSGKIQTLQYAERVEVTMKDYTSVVGNSGTSAQEFTMLVNLWELKKEKTGIKMVVTPFVNGENEITMKIGLDQTEKVGKEVDAVSAYTGYDKLGPTGLRTDYPDIVENRAFDTLIRLKDGETVVIGGLISEGSENLHETTPFINKLPVIGSLFQRKTTKSSRAEMVILVTTYIVNKDLDEKLAKGKEEFSAEKYQDIMEKVKRVLR